MSELVVKMPKRVIRIDGHYQALRVSVPDDGFWFMPFMRLDREIMSGVAAHRWMRHAPAHAPEGEWDYER